MITENKLIWYPYIPQGSKDIIMNLKNPKISGLKDLFIFFFKEIKIDFFSKKIYNHDNGKLIYFIHSKILCTSFSLRLINIIWVL